MEFQPGDLKYDDSNFIGRGGFAEVYRVVIHHKKQEMIVAVKQPTIGGSMFTDKYGLLFCN